VQAAPLVQQPAARPFTRHLSNKKGGAPCRHNRKNRYQFYPFDFYLCLSASHAFINGVQLFIYLPSASLAFSQQLSSGAALVQAAPLVQLPASFAVAGTIA
jgi:hypothetical protein